MGEPIYEEDVLRDFVEEVGATALLAESRVGVTSSSSSGKPAGRPAEQRHAPCLLAAAVLSGGELCRCLGCCHIRDGQTAPWMR